MHLYTYKLQLEADPSYNFSYLKECYKSLETENIHAIRNAIQPNEKSMQPLSSFLTNYQIYRSHIFI